jgi:crossover junction endodeoxyribonuclease RuvC
MGLGLLKTKGKNLEVLDMKELFLYRISDNNLKFKKILSVILEIIDNYSPKELAIESTFFGKNAQSALKIGRAQGIAISAALYKQIIFAEYSPRKIKMSITGYGNATKDQVANTLKKLLKLKQFPCSHFDASDAIAVAVCHSKCRDI